MKKNRENWKVRGRKASFDVEYRIQCAGEKVWGVYVTYDACVRDNDWACPKPFVKCSFDTYKDAADYLDTLDGKSSTEGNACFGYLRRYGLGVSPDLELIKMGYTESQIDKMFKVMQKAGAPLMWSVCEKPDKAPKKIGKGAYQVAQYENDLAVYDRNMRKCVSCECDGCVVTFYMPA